MSIVVEFAALETHALGLPASFLRRRDAHLHLCFFRREVILTIQHLSHSLALIGLVILVVESKLDLLLGLLLRGWLLHHCVLAAARIPCVHRRQHVLKVVVLGLRSRWLPDGLSPLFRLLRGQRVLQEAVVDLLWDSLRLLLLFFRLIRFDPRRCPQLLRGLLLLLGFFLLLKP